MGRSFFLPYFYSMNWKLCSYLTIIGVVACVLLACKKNSAVSSNEQAQFDSAVNVQANDQVRVASDIDAIFNDVNTVMTKQDSVIAGHTGTLQNTGICAATSILLDGVDTPNNISLTYGGNVCDDSRVFSGNVTVYFTPGSDWSAVNNVLGVNLTNLHIKGLQSDTSTILYNGNFYFSNVSGGRPSDLTSAASAPVVQSIQGNNISLLFNVVTPAVWQIARQRTYTYNNGLVISTTGTDTAGGLQNVTEYGGNRYGNSFITSVDSPLISSQACDFQLTGGQIRLTNPSGVTTVLFGLNSSGTSGGCPSSGSSYYYQLNWTGSDESPYSSVRSYPYHN